MLEKLSNRFQGTRQVLVPQSAMPGKRSAACVLQVTMQAGLLGPKRPGLRDPPLRNADEGLRIQNQKASNLRPIPYGPKP